MTIGGILASVLTDPASGLSLTAAQIGYVAAIYIAGPCLGALFFSYLTDRYGRKKLFLITLALYLVTTVPPLSYSASATSPRAGSVPAPG